VQQLVDGNTYTELARMPEEETVDGGPCPRVTFVDRASCCRHIGRRSDVCFGGNDSRPTLMRWILLSRKRPGSRRHNRGRDGVSP